MQLTVIDPEDLAQIVQNAVNAALAAREAKEDRPLSAREVARRARRRMGDVCAALASGALPARRTGRAWHVAPAACSEWIAKGCPL